MIIASINMLFLETLKKKKDITTLNKVPWKELKEA